MPDDLLLRALGKADILKFTVLMPPVDVDYRAVRHGEADGRDTQMQNVRLLAGKIHFLQMLVLHIELCRVLEKFLALMRRFNAVTRSGKNLNAGLSLQLLDAAAQGRLRNIEPLGRAVDRSAAADFERIANVVQIHCISLPLSARSPCARALLCLFRISGILTNNTPEHIVISIHKMTKTDAVKATQSIKNVPESSIA